MTKLLGILNLTPDSFSDGGKFTSHDTVYQAVTAMIEAGAYGIDIGAESTRPHANPLTAEEEWARLAPVLNVVMPLLQKASMKLSIDTRHAETARRALDNGADWINDVSGGENAEMVEAVKGRAERYVIMHHLGIPANPKQTLPETEDAVQAITQWFNTRIARLLDQGITASQLVLDPGIGFGKTTAQNWHILQNIASLKTSLPFPLLVGHSRKSFLSAITPVSPEERDLESCVVSCHLASCQVEYLRIHNVPAHKRALRAWAALQPASSV